MDFSKALKQSQSVRMTGMSNGVKIFRSFDPTIPASERKVQEWFFQNPISGAIEKWEFEFKDKESLRAAIQRAKDFVFTYHSTLDDWSLTHFRGVALEGKANALHAEAFAKFADSIYGESTSSSDSLEGKGLEFFVFDKITKKFGIVKVVDEKSKEMQLSLSQIPASENTIVFALFTNHHGGVNNADLSSLDFTPAMMFNGVQMNAAGKMFYRCQYSFTTDLNWLAYQVFGSVMPASLRNLHYSQTSGRSGAPVHIFIPVARQAVERHAVSAKVFSSFRHVAPWELELGRKYANAQKARSFEAKYFLPPSAILMASGFGNGAVKHTRRNGIQDERIPEAALRPIPVIAGSSSFPLPAPAAESNGKLQNSGASAIPCSQLASPASAENARIISAPGISQASAAIASLPGASAEPAPRKVSSPPQAFFPATTAGAFQSANAGAHQNPQMVMAPKNSQVWENGKSAVSFASNAVSHRNSTAIGSRHAVPSASSGIKSASLGMKHASGVKHAPRVKHAGKSRRNASKATSATLAQPVSAAKNAAGAIIPMKNSIRAIIFDLDGVLANSEPIHFAAFSEIVAPYGVKIDRQYYYANYIGRGAKHIFEDLFEKNSVGAPVEPLMKLQVSLVEGQIRAGMMQPIRGAPKLVQLAKNSRIKVAIASGSPRKLVEAELGAIGLAGLPAVTFNDVKHKKPHPESFLKAAKKLGVPPRECLVVEDSSAGVLAAKRAGMPCLLLSNNAPANLRAMAAKTVPTLDSASLRAWAGGLFAAPKAHGKPGVAATSASKNSGGGSKKPWNYSPPTSSSNKLLRGKQNTKVRKWKRNSHS